MQWIIRFILGGVIISLFASIGDVLRPKGFAGLFGAAPSVALATLSLTIAMQGAQLAALQARSMIVGAGAFVIYGLCCVYFMGVKRFKASQVAVIALGAWAVAVAGLWAVFFR